MSLFRDRRRAGKQLSKHLENKIDFDAVVVPYLNACEIGLELAESQNADIEVRLSDFISSPEPPYMNIGAAVEDGTLWIEDNLKNELDVSSRYINSAARIQTKFLETKSVELVQDNLDLEGSTVLVASDGLSSGFREAAVAGSLIKQGANGVVITAPVKSDNVMADLESVSQEIYSLQEVSFLSKSDDLYDKSSENSKEGQEKHLTA